MASLSQVTEERRRLRKRRAGAKRKHRAGRKSTVSYDELFAALGTPGEPAPAPAPATQASPR